MKKRVLALIMATAMLVTVCGGGQMLCRTVKAQMQKAYVIQNAAPLPTQTPSGGEREDFWCDSTRIKTNGDYKYHILSEEKKLITIRKIENANGKLEIPEEIDGYKVVGIGRSDRLPSRLGIAESEYEYSDFGLEEMSVLPESSGGVTEIIIPKYIQFVGICAFENCNSLKKVKINKRDVNLYLYGEAFLDCNKLESVNLPEKVCTDGDVFSCCGTIDEVTMGISMSTNADDSAACRAKLRTSASGGSTSAGTARRNVPSTITATAPSVVPGSAHTFSTCTVRPPSGSLSSSRAKAEKESVTPQVSTTRPSPSTAASVWISPSLRPTASRGTASRSVIYSTPPQVKRAGSAGSSVQTFSPSAQQPVRAAASMRTVHRTARIPFCFFMFSPLLFASAAVS